MQSKNDTDEIRIVERVVEKHVSSKTGLRAALDKATDSVNEILDRINFNIYDDYEIFSVIESLNEEGLEDIAEDLKPVITNMVKTSSDLRIQVSTVREIIDTLRRGD